LRFATLTTRDVSLDALAETSRTIMQASKRTLKALGVTDYAGHLETSFQDWSDDYHPHIHALIDSPPAGRGYIPLDRWQDAWLGELPEFLHPIEGGAHVNPVRDLAASCEYLTKSPFYDFVQQSQAANVRRVVAAICESKGLHKFASRGSLARCESDTYAQCAA
jgi:hypothetical protein